MKQGRADHSNVASTKREPVSHAVSPAAVSELGIIQVRTVSQPLYTGRGFEAPAIQSSTHASGSQGKHK